LAGNNRHPKTRKIAKLLFYKDNKKFTEVGMASALSKTVPISIGQD
jgi:hypothetical protein